MRFVPLWMSEGSRSRPERLQRLVAEAMLFNESVDDRRSVRRLALPAYLKARGAGCGGTRWSGGRQPQWSGRTQPAGWGGGSSALAHAQRAWMSWRWERSRSPTDRLRGAGAGSAPALDRLQSVAQAPPGAGDGRLLEPDGSGTMSAADAPGTPGLRIGCAGWSLPRAAQAAFGAGDSVLQRYATRLPMVEINRSTDPTRPGPMRDGRRACRRLPVRGETAARRSAMNAGCATRCSRWSGSLKALAR
jgi:hypothetical protein